MKARKLSFGEGIDLLICLICVEEIVWNAVIFPEFPSKIMLVIWGLVLARTGYNLIAKANIPGVKDE